MNLLFKSLAILTASASFALANRGNWMTDWEAAKAKAVAENKPIFFNLTGSDWCAWCIKIEKEIFSQKAFQDFAAENVILFEADIPKNQAGLDKQSPELRKQNAELEKIYYNKGFPSVYVLDPAGNKLTEDIGELKGGTDAYLAKIREAIDSRKK